MQYPTVISLPWNANIAEQYFSALSKYPWAILLHSGYSKHLYGRFDILSADPIGTITTRGNSTYVSLHETFSSSEDPFLLLNETLNACNFRANVHSDLPFQGGAMGLFGYDLVRRLEKLPEHAMHDIDLPDMAVGLYDWALIVDHHKKKVSFLSYSNIDSRLKWFKEKQKSSYSNFRLTSSWKTNMSYKEYEKKFNQVQNYLKNGDCYQVNLAQRFHNYYRGDEWQAFVQLNLDNHAPFSAFLRLEEGVILSFSPERFVHLSNGIIQSRPIKGTLPRINSAESDKKQIHCLINSSKDRAENLMIVDLIRNDIGRVAVPGTVRVPEMFVVESFSSVHHLVSTITARLLSSYKACDLLRAMFPGGSITGAPKVRAMEIIDELEPQRRNAWCGSIGYLSICGNMDSNIAIRTLTAFNDRLYCSAGGGIIYDSQIHIEYREIFDKISSILKQLEK